MTGITNTKSLTPEERHIASLIRNGSRIKAPDGSAEPLTTDFCRKAAEQCVSNGYNAITYDLILPDIEEELALCVWADGHVDSGTKKSICEDMYEPSCWLYSVIIPSVSFICSSEKPFTHVFSNPRISLNVPIRSCGSHIVSIVTDSL